jgi:hypothetical protein
MDTIVLVLLVLYVLGVLGTRLYVAARPYGYGADLIGALLLILVVLRVFRPAGLH